MTTGYELQFVEACILVIEDYLLSHELDWPAGVSAEAGQPPYPRLTLGNFLLFLQRLHGRQASSQLTAAQEDRLAHVEARLEAERSHWHSHWSQKAEREFGYRLRMWGNYLEDFRENASANVDRFAYEVRLRAILELLEPEVAQMSAAERDMLRGLDLILRNRLVAGEFIWDHEVRLGFPRENYWFLYGTLKINHG
jgi:hypothetical protein